jgi:membrane-bound lytic murein transglycosylase D
MVNKDFHLSQISEVMNIPLGELKALNPQYRTGLIPGGTKRQSLTLPLSHLSDFIGLNDTIRSYKSNIYLNKTDITVNPATSVYQPPQIKGKTKIYYTVKDGDNLGFISEWFRVGLTDLRYWNDIYGNTIRVGQKIALFVDPAKVEYFSRINNMAFAEKQGLSGKSISISPPVAKVSTVTETESESDSDSDYIYYTVQNGDTIWDIVKKFESVSTAEVLALNSISDPGRIQVGQKLKIKKKS